MKELLIRLFISKGVLYRDLFLYPPKNVKWRTDVKLDDFDTLQLYSPKQKVIRKIAYSIYESLNSPRFAYLLNVDDCDLIYSTRGISIKNKQNWITDFEHVSHFSGLNRTKILNESMKNKIKKYISSRFCKRILPHTKIALETFKSVFGNYENDKMEILYHTMMPTNLINRFDRDKINILFNGNFYHKGGDVAINAFEILNQQYNNIQMTIVSNPPEHLISYYKKKYSNIFFYKKGPNITRPDLINQFYMNADIFLYPSQGDTYANPLLLAMNSALPIITTDYYAFPEFVENKKNGYMIKSNLWEIEKTIPAGNIPYIESEKIIRKNNKQNIIEIVNYTEELIDNAQQRRSMGRIGREILESGKLSIKVRDSKLLSIFKNSIE